MTSRPRPLPAVPSALLAVAVALLWAVACSSSPKLSAEECLRKTNEALSTFAAAAGNGPAEVEAAAADMEKLNQELVDAGCPAAVSAEGR